MINRLSHFLSATSVLAMVAIGLSADPSIGNPKNSLNTSSKLAPPKESRPENLAAEPATISRPTETSPGPVPDEKTQSLSTPRKQNASRSGRYVILPAVQPRDARTGRYIIAPRDAHSTQKPETKTNDSQKRTVRLDPNIPELPPRMPETLRIMRKNSEKNTSSKGTNTKPKTAKAPFKVPKHGSLLLFEPATGKILYHLRADRQTFPASLTKMMTAYVVFEAVEAGELKLDSNLVFSPHARSQPATRVGLKKGIDVSIDTAVRALIIRSANDFAVALAETVSGSEAQFIDRMNNTARRLGMSRTNFANPHGLPNPFQVSTARDFALLTTALARDFPQYADVFSNESVNIRKLELRTHNSLLRTFLGTDGMKTGFTCASGYNIVASATRDGRRLAVVVIGALRRSDRDAMAAKALEYGFQTLADNKSNGRVTLASLPVTGKEEDDTLNLQQKTRTWACGNGPTPRKVSKRKSKSKKKYVKKKATKKKK